MTFRFRAGRRRPRRAPQRHRGRRRRRGHRRQVAQVRGREAVSGRAQVEQLAPPWRPSTKASWSRPGRGRPGAAAPRRRRRARPPRPRPSEAPRRSRGSVRTPRVVRDHASRRFPASVRRRRAVTPGATAFGRPPGAGSPVEGSAVATWTRTTWNSINTAASTSPSRTDFRVLGRKRSARHWPVSKRRTRTVHRLRAECRTRPQSRGVSRRVAAGRAFARVRAAHTAFSACPAARAPASCPAPVTAAMRPPHGSPMGFHSGRPPHPRRDETRVRRCFGLAIAALAYVPPRGVRGLADRPRVERAHVHRPVGTATPPAPATAGRGAAWCHGTCATGPTATSTPSASWPPARWTRRGRRRTALCTAGDQLHARHREDGAGGAFVTWATGAATLSGDSTPSTCWPRARSIRCGRRTDARSARPPGRDSTSRRSPRRRGRRHRHLVGLARRLRPHLRPSRAGFGRCGPGVAGRRPPGLRRRVPTRRRPRSLRTARRGAIITWSNESSDIYASTCSLRRGGPGVAGRRPRALHRYGDPGWSHDRPRRCGRRHRDVEDRVAARTTTSTPGTCWPRARWTRRGRPMAARSAPPRATNAPSRSSRTARAAPWSRGRTSVAARAGTSTPSTCWLRARWTRRGPRTARCCARARAPVTRPT